MKLLFVNSCIRGEDSRTLELCRDFLQKFAAKTSGLPPAAAPGGAEGKAVADGGWTVEEVDLGAMDIRPLDAATLAQRDEYMKAGRTDAPMLALARQFIEADLVLVGAPYWDLSFPARLKAYIEQCSVTGLTFVYSPQGTPQGQCRARALVYITTSGSAIGSFNFGYDYFRGVCALFGIGKTYFASAEELDIIGKDVAAIMARAKDKITAIAEELASA